MELGISDQEISTIRAPATILQADPPRSREVALWRPTMAERSSNTDDISWLSGSVNMSHCLPSPPPYLWYTETRIGIDVWVSVFPFLFFFCGGGSWGKFFLSFFGFLFWNHTWEQESLGIAISIESMPQMSLLLKDLWRVSRKSTDGQTVRLRQTKEWRCFIVQATWVKK